MAPRKTPVKNLDVSVLQKMTEPITVRVEKMRANQKMPLFVPGRDPGLPPGCGWTREDVLNLETFIQNAAGGGFYTATVTDTDGQTMTWDFGWDPRQVPEKNYDPGGNSMAALTATTSPAAAPPPVQVPMASTPFGSTSNWLQGYLAHSTPIAPAAAPAPQTPWVPSWGGGWGAATPIPSAAPASPAQIESERMRMLEERLNQSERDKLAQKHGAELSALSSRHAHEMAAIREEMRRLGEGSKPSAESTELQTVRQELERERAAREREAAERARREELAAMERRHQDQMAAIKALVESKTSSAEDTRVRELEARLERQDEQRRRDEEQRRRDEQHREQMQALRDQIATGRPDPVVELMKETSRQQVESSREALRTQQAQAAQLATTMVNPVQLVEMLQRSGNQGEEFVKSMIGTFSGVLETYRGAMESMMQLQGGGQSPGMTMVQEGLARASELANQYMDVQRAKAVSDARARGQAAQASAAAAAAMAQARQQPWQQPPSSAAPAGTLDGAQQPPNGQAGTPQPPQPQPAPSGDGENLASVIDFRGRQAPSEEEMFGEALDQVHRLRLGVEEGQLSPAQAVEAILKGVTVVQQQQLVIPVFTLFMEGRIPDFIDALLPAAPQEFRDACAQLIYQQVAAYDEDDDEEGEYPEDDGEYADG